MTQGILNVGGALALVGGIVAAGLIILWFSIHSISGPGSEWEAPNSDEGLDSHD